MKRVFVVLAIMALAGGAAAQQAIEPSRKLGVVATAHLDTQWRWTIQNTINEYVPATFRDNFKLLDLYPSYTFSFEGAFRYQLLREYYPEEYARLRPYINARRWRVTGSWVDAADVNLPSFESLVRQTLYGNGYFKREFGVTSRDIFLPDCFGFGYALPSVARHCGLESFSSQKLSWGSAYGVPFDIGVWTGIDGSSMLAALRPDAYVAEITDDLSRDSIWLGRIDSFGAAYGLYVGYKYIGTGDVGGAPDSATVARLEQSIHSDGPIRVSSIGADDLCDMFSESERDRLPQYRGELLMTRHGVGCYSSQAAMKRWNRKNELLADAAERASVIAHLAGGYEYPRAMLADTWTRFLWHQFHDDLTGTSIPEAYEFSWNDELLCQNRFASILENAVEAFVPTLDTRTPGTPLVLFNPLSIEREDVVEASVIMPGGAPAYVKVTGPDGREVPSQVIAASGDTATILFLAFVPPVGYAVYDVQPARTPSPFDTNLGAATSTLENNRYRVMLTTDGDIASIFDKVNDREMLAAPIRYQLLYDKPQRWPAWEIQYEDITAPPARVLTGPAEIRVLEKGPVRAALEVIRHTDSSTFRTIIRLSSGDAGERVEFVNEVDWREHEALLKAAIVTAAPDDSVTYDLGLGTITRGLNHAKLYEVPGHQWADMTAASGEYGVAVLNDCKYGWDHPDPGTLRLTLIHTPGVHDSWEWVGDQASQDVGDHQFTFALSGHSGDWRDGGVPWQAARLNQPIRAFQTSREPGPLGRSYSLLAVNDVDPAGFIQPGVMVNAVKLAENSDEMIVRVRELWGQSHESVALHFTESILAAREVNGVEESVGEAIIENGAVVFSLAPYQPRAFAVKLNGRSDMAVAAPSAFTVSLPYNEDGISSDLNRRDGDFDGRGNTLVDELLPQVVTYRNVSFETGPREPDALNVVACHGQEIALPAESFNRVHVLAAAVDGAIEAIFFIDGKPYPVQVPDYAEPIAQWNNRLSGGLLHEEPDEIAPGYILRTPVAWYGSHRHTENGENEAYRFTYLFEYRFDTPGGARMLVLPDNQRVKVLAVTAVQSSYADIRPAALLYDAADGVVVRINAERAAFLDPLPVELKSPNAGAAIYYTLDGSAPTEESPRYAEPLVITATSTLKARAFVPGAENRYVASKEFTRLELRPATEVAAIDSGLACRYYEGEWEEAPNFDSLEAKQEFVASEIAIPSFASEELFGLAFKGYVNIPVDGLYEFGISSDDGSLLWVSDSLVVNNDGVHGGGLVYGLVALRAGLHPLKVHMFQAKGDRELSVVVKGPSTEEQPLPPEWLYH